MTFWTFFVTFKLFYWLFNRHLSAYQFSNSQSLPCKLRIPQENMNWYLWLFRGFRGEPHLVHAGKLKYNAPWLHWHLTYHSRVSWNGFIFADLQGFNDKTWLQWHLAYSYEVFLYVFCLGSDQTTQTVVVKILSQKYMALK